MQAVGPTAIGLVLLYQNVKILERAPGAHHVLNQCNNVQFTVSLTRGAGRSTSLTGANTKIFYLEAIESLDSRFTDD